MKDGAPAKSAGSELTRIGGILLGLGMIIGAVNNKSIQLSNQILPVLPAPGVLVLRVAVTAVGAVLLLWGLDALLNFQIGHLVAGLRNRLFQPSPHISERIASPKDPTAAFLESKQFRAYAQQLKAERDVAVRRAEDSKANPEAQLVVKAEFLVQAMRALEDGYRKVFGSLLGFDERWNAKRRQQAKSDLDDWLDRRVLIPMITQWSAELQHSAPDTEAVQRLVVSVARFFSDAVDPLLGLKQLYDVREHLVRALEQGKDYEFVRSWAKRVLNQVDEGAPDLAEADMALGMLRASVSANREPRPAELPRNRVATTQSSGEGVELQKFRMQVAELQELRRDGVDFQRRLSEGQDIRFVGALIRDWHRRARKVIDESPELTLDQKRKVPILSRRPNAEELARVVQDTLALLPETKQ